MSDVYFCCEHDFYRVALVDARDRRNKAIPALRNFDLSPADNFKLSVDCASLTHPEETVARVGAQIKSDGTFKEFRNREIYAIHSSLLNSIDQVLGVLQDALYYHPPARGFPNNHSHALIHYQENYPEYRPEILEKLREHAKDRKVSFDMTTVEALVSIYQKQWQ